MFRITGNKQNVNVKECIASTESDLPNRTKCEEMVIGIGSECFIINTASVAFLDEGYNWVVK